MTEMHCQNRSSSSSGIIHFGLFSIACNSILDVKLVNHVFNMINCLNYLILPEVTGRNTVTTTIDTPRYYYIICINCTKSYCYSICKA